MNFSGLLKNDSKRFERKFLISFLDKSEIENSLKLHPALFTEIFEQRTVNNIYFDTFDLKNYQENVIGSQRRIKIRIRWYGDLLGSIENPILELKIKDGLAGWKLSYSLKKFDLDGGHIHNRLQEVFSLSDLPPNVLFLLKTMEPTLLNSYERKYFISADKTFRATIDFQMEYSRIAPACNLFIDRDYDRANTVLELKYNPGADSDASRIAGYFPFRVTKNSKYVSGLERLNHW